MQNGVQIITLGIWAGGKDYVLYSSMRWNPCCKEVIAAGVGIAPQHAYTSHMQVR
jgi:hypothetical protein